jgi:hypothetical protein
MPCCAIALLALLGPRVLLVLLWLFNRAYFIGPTDNFLLQVLGVIFLPWTLLGYVFSLNTFPGADLAGLSIIGLVITGIGLLLDLGSYGGGYRNRGYRYNN